MPDPHTEAMIALVQKFYALPQPLPRFFDVTEAEMKTLEAEYALLHAETLMFPSIEDYRAAGILPMFMGLVVRVVP